jgi:uncharacterized membrane protein YkvA (DUF1232 family)
MNDSSRLATSPGLLSRWKAAARRLKREVYALWLAAKDPRTPWYARLVVALVVAYALSPLDLIPDFIPVLGLVDDLVLVPLGIALAVKLIPGNVLDEARAAADTLISTRPRSRVGMGIVAGLWLAGAVVIGLILHRVLAG